MTQGFRTSYLDEPVRLSELRAKTDKQLQGLVHSKLELGLNFIVLAEAGDRANAERSLKRADQAMSEVQQVLPALNDEQRRLVARKLNDLREALDGLGHIRGCSRTQTASMS